MVDAQHVGLTWVVVHPEWGVYAGHALGMAFFSLQDVAAQPVAVTFESQAEAVEHIRSWRNEGLDFDPESFSYHDVACDNPAFATPDEMAAAGIPDEMIKPFRQAEIQNREIQRDLDRAMRPH